MVCVSGHSQRHKTAAVSQFLAARRLRSNPHKVNSHSRMVAVAVYTGGQNVKLKIERIGHAFVCDQYLSGCNQKAYLEANRCAQLFRKEVCAASTCGSLGNYISSAKIRDEDNGPLSRSLKFRYSLAAQVSFRTNLVSLP